MLQVLIGRLVVDERERAIQRQLREHAARRAAPAAEANAIATARPSHDPAAHAAGGPCVACQTTPATIS